MDYWETLKEPEGVEARPPSPSPSTDGPHWRVLTDATRGGRRLRIDADGRPAAWIDAAGARLDFAHDADGNLRRIDCGPWFTAIEGSAPGRTLRVTDRAGHTDLLLAKAGRERTIERGGHRLSVAFDALERVRRVVLPGSANALAYDWDEDGGCVIRAEGGGPLLTLSAAGAARRIALDPATWWDEEVQPGRVRLAATLDGSVHDTLDLRLTGLAAIAERRWRDGSGDRFERDERGRLSAWQAFDADGETIERRWRYLDDDLVEDAGGRRTLGDGGRVLALDRPDGDRVAYRYDANGRRVARFGRDGETHYAYDPLGTLVAINAGGGETRLETDGMGRRVAVRRDGRAARHEHRDEAGRLWAVTGDDGRALHAYIWIGDRIAARIDGAVGAPIAEAYPCDPLGTPNGVFVATGEEWRFERLDAPPFGRADNEARPTLYGHFGDPDTGLIHCGARELDPELGLFLTPDPWHGGEDDPRRWAGATEALLQRDRERPAEGFHDYALCRFDPLGRYDRDGHVSAGDVFLHILRWILLPTWGFPLTSISVFFFQPFNLYMEIVGLIVWAIKQACEDKSHPWGVNTIAKATWLLGSTRQFTFAFGLNGFLPRVVTGGGFNADRAVTIGNVIWINSDELDFLGRAEVVEVDDIGGAAGRTKFNDDPAIQSVVALLSADKKALERLHVSAWTRGVGNAVAVRAGVQAFADTAAAGAAAGAIHLLHPVPLGMPLPNEDDDKEKLEVREFTRAAADPAANLEAVVDVWFALKVPKETGFVVGDWLRISAPKAADPKPDAAFRRIRDVLPAADHVALILTEALPARFVTASLSSGLKIEAAQPAGGAVASADWTATATATTLTRAVAAAAADFPPDLSADSMVRIVAATGVVPPRLPGLPAGAAEDTRYTGVKALRPRLTLAPDSAGVAVGATMRRLAPHGPLFHGVVEAVADLAKIKLSAPHPGIAAGDLIVVTGGGATAYVRATAAPAGDVLAVDPALPAAMAPADGAAVDLQGTAESGADAGTATVTKVTGADVDANVPRGDFLAIGNLVGLDVGGVPALRRIDAIPQMEIDLADEPVGTGLLGLTRVAAIPDRVRSGVELAPPGRFLRWVSGTDPGLLGEWPDKLLAIELTGGFSAAVKSTTAAYYVRWPAAGRPASFDPDFHRAWSIVTQNGDQYFALETPLPFVRHKDTDGKMKTWWRTDPDDHAGDSDIPIDPVPVPLALRAVELARSGADRADHDGRRVLAHEPELLVPDYPQDHDTHRRALIEHEIHHTVQCNYWGPMMGALPLQGLIMSVADFVPVAGTELPDWMQQVDRDAHGNPPVTAAGRIKHNTELNPFQVFSIGGIMQLAWKYAFLLPFRGSPALAGAINDWDFEDFNKVFNPVSRLITQNLPQVDPDAAPGTRWLQLIAQTFSKALDLRSWTPFLGFVPTLLPDGPTNFIEQGASRASGDLYSTILTANDRYNLRSRGRLFGSKESLEADLHACLGRPVRLLMFCGYRSDRVLDGAQADVPGASLAFRKGFGIDDPFTITLPDPGQKILVQALLYDVRRAGGAAALPPVLIEGPPAARAAVAFLEASTGDTVIPRLRALVPLPPRVNRTLGFYMLAAGPGRLTIKAPIPLAVDAEIAISGTVGTGDTVTLTATSPTLPGSPLTLGPVAALAGQGASDLVHGLAAAVRNDATLLAAGVWANEAGDTVQIVLPRAQEPKIVWEARKTGAVKVKASSGKAAIADAGTETVTLTIEAEVKLDEELVAWSAPAGTGALPAGPAALKRYQTEETEFRLRQPKTPKGGAFVDAGIADLVLDLSDATILTEPLPGDIGWKIIMPKAVPAAPARLRLYRIVKKDDPAFDLAFPDVPSLAGVASYLDADTFVVLRDVLLQVEALPELPDATNAFDAPFELTLPIRLVARERGIVITPPAGATAPPVSLIGKDGRGEKWKIGPLADPPGDDTEYTVTVTYGRPGNSVDKSFKLTLKPAIKVTGASFDVLPGTPLDLDIARGTPPYTVKLEPALAGLVMTQPAAGKVRLLASAAPDAVTDVKVMVTDSAAPPAIGVRHVSVKTMPPILMPNDSADYFPYVRPATLGLARPLINGRSSGGPGPNVDLTEPLDAMENAVKALGAGDCVYLSAWFFEPATGLTAGGMAGVTTWGQLFAKKANDGVKIRLLINDFDPISGMDAWLRNSDLVPLDAIIAAMPAAKRDNLKYLVCLHPAHVGALKAMLAGQGRRNIYIASHHQKFMVVRKGAEMTVFCGGLDIESRKTPAKWSDAGLAGWHDIHVQLEGPITRDLEREFVARWNRDRNASTRAPVAGWAAMETLAVTPLSPADDTAAKKRHVMQMVRTISDNGTTGPYSTERDDIKQTYRRAIKGGTQFLYFENQYFRSLELADWIVAAGLANPALVVVMVVVGSAGADDGANALTEHGDHLQFETFDKIKTALGARAAFYTMKSRAVHSKFLLVDDVWMTIGSANANVRSFELDSELNVQIGDPALTKAFRARLWAHNLGAVEATVAGWAPADFIAQWNLVAAANGAVPLGDMVGEGVIAYDHAATPGVGHGSIPDALVQLDFGTDGGIVEDPAAPPPDLPA
jgi:YD repeat-containing protein